MSKLVIFVATLLVITSGCVYSDVGNNKKYQDQGLLGPEISAEEMQGFGPANLEHTASETITYTDDVYAFTFTYPRLWSLAVQQKDSGEFLTVDNASGASVATIDIRMMETEDWEQEKYAQVIDKQPVFVSEEEKLGSTWKTFYLNDTIGHLFTVSCLWSECDSLIANLHLDSSLTGLSSVDFVGTWDGHANAQKVLLSIDGSFLMSGDDTSTRGTWKFEKDVLTLSDTKGKVLLSSRVNDEYGVLYLSDIHETWTKVQNDVTAFRVNTERDYDTAIDANLGPSPSFSYIADSRALVGSWRVVEGADYEEITLNADGTFSTFLHTRPFLDGTWQLEDGHLTLSSNLGETYYVTGAFEEGNVYWENDSLTVAMWEPVN